MLRGRKTLWLIALLPVLFTPGCEWMGIWAASTGGYIATGDQMTKCFTEMSNSDGAVNVADAVQVWMNRNQLPLPVLPEGSHSFSVRVGNSVEVKGSRGAKNVQLIDNGTLIAEYVVAWDKKPVQYRLVSATNRVYEGALDVSEVPVIKTQFPD